MRKDDGGRRPCRKAAIVSTQMELKIYLHLEMRADEQRRANDGEDDTVFDFAHISEE